MSAARERAFDALAVLVGKAQCAWAAPGRVNLIGEHVDYHDGFVCPIAIDRDTVVAARRRDDRIVRVISADREGTGTIALDRSSARSGAWFDYVAGVVRALEADGPSLRGADLAIASDVPIGAGLSSSAALEIAVGAALLEIGGQDPDRRRLAAAGRLAENEFVGIRTGIMDQLIVALAQRDRALEIDCRTQHLNPVRIPHEAVFVIADCGVRHALASSSYNERRIESENAAARLGMSLRDAGVADIERADLPAVLRRRAMHVVTENARVKTFVRTLERGDLVAAGATMTASHRSLRDDYEVSIPELDRLVEHALNETGVYGARMTGGGFGGSIVVLTSPERVDDVLRTLTRHAADATVVRASDGVRKVA